MDDVGVDMITYFMARNPNREFAEICVEFASHLEEEDDTYSMRSSSVHSEPDDLMDEGNEDEDDGDDVDEGEHRVVIEGACAMSNVETYVPATHYFVLPEDYDNEMRVDSYGDMNDDLGCRPGQEFYIGQIFCSKEAAQRALNLYAMERNF
ncbi:unnamed protein product [Linum trigynum]|uniref:Uncharacterized protein n=1 Tax=Linum trigynum TaxID=586398 RepID=A0AAV2GCC8_9ROSI